MVFVAEGIITVTEESLGRLTATNLKPTQLVVAADESSVTVDLTGAASLQLDAVDAGVETPDANDSVPGAVSLRRTAEDDTKSLNVEPGALGFPVEGAIRNSPEETFEALSGGSLTLESITFAVEDAVKSDGGSSDVLSTSTSPTTVSLSQRHHRDRNWRSCNRRQTFVTGHPVDLMPRFRFTPFDWVTRPCSGRFGHFGALCLPRCIPNLPFVRRVRKSRSPATSR